MDPALIGLRSALFAQGGAETVTIDIGAGPVPARAIRAQDPGDGFDRRPSTTFELQLADVPSRPAKGFKITAADGDWYAKTDAEPALLGRWLVHAERRGA